MTNLVIKMIENIYNKEGRKWVEVDSNISHITQEEYNNIVNNKKFFTNLGGYERHYKNYTCKGCVVTRIISIDPSKESKIERLFKFSYEEV